VINKELVKEYINKIYVGNTTNLFEGLLLGYQQVNSVKSDNTLNRVLLLTDGEPTAGTKDFASIVAQVGDQKARGITVTALGFGPDYNEELMAGIARRSGGNYYNIVRSELIPEVFRKELDTLMRTAARNLRFRLHLPSGVTVKQAYGNTPAHGDRSAEVTLSDVEHNSSLTSLWELELAPRPPGVYRVAQAELVYDDAITGEQEHLEADVVVRFVTQRARVDCGVDERVKREIEIAEAAKSLDRTVSSMRTQQIDAEAVMRELNRTKTLMLDRGLLAQADQITQAIQEIEDGGRIEKTLVRTIYNMDQGKDR
jgi:Ca-activated chloride channel family protein